MAELLYDDGTFINIDKIVEPLLDECDGLAPEHLEPIVMREVPNFKFSKVFKDRTGARGKRMNHYLCRVYNGDKCYQYKFTDSIYNTQNGTPSHRMEMAGAIFLDASAFEYNDTLEDFQRAFGYEDEDELKRAFEGCRKAFKNLLQLYGAVDYNKLQAIFRAI